jgi:nucleoid-associated protein YgaU
MGAARVLPVVAEEADPAIADRRVARRALEARRADAARRRRRAGSSSPGLFAGDGRLRLVPRFELTGHALVANDDLASLRRPPSAAPDRTARPVGPAAVLVAPRPAPAGPAPRVRPSAATYRRRRLVAGALLLGLLLAGCWALGVLGGGPLTASEAGSRPAAGARAAVSIAGAAPVSRRSYVVQPGDTLWSIARALQGPSDRGADVRPVVDALAAERHGRPLEVGETIVLP